MVSQRPVRMAVCCLVVLLLWFICRVSCPGEVAGESDLNAKLAQLNIDTATLDDVIRIFGEPEKYIWGKQTFLKTELPSRFIAVYPNGFRVFMLGKKIVELRHHQPGYLYRGKLQVGSSLEEVIAVIGKPKETVVGERNEFEDGVLYKDIDGRKGYCYYCRCDQRVRFFFRNYEVGALYVTRSDRGKRPASFQTVRPVTSVKHFDDVRWKDMRQLDLSEKRGLPATLRFNQKTLWPERGKMPAGVTPKRVLTEAMNPGVGVRKLHRRGITGKGVNVAIIDQPLYLDHPEFPGKIVAYHDVGCGSESSMHGPAVASLLVGAKCGTAPDARVYYAAAPSWTKDTAYQAKALRWIIDQSERLPASKKIRVVSVSAAPSGRGSPFEKNQKMWDEACARAEAAEILVLDCTRHRGWIGPCWYDASDPENVAKCTPGFPGRISRGASDRLLVPCSPRTTAEEYRKGQFGYQYCGRGGLSWSIPYCAGVLALGWQIRPDIPPKQMRELLLQSAHRKDNGGRIIDPKGFIRLVRKARVTT